MRQFKTGFKLEREREVKMDSEGETGIVRGMVYSLMLHIC